MTITPVGLEPEERSSLAIMRVAAPVHGTIATTSRWLWSSSLEGWSKMLADNSVVFIGKDQFNDFEKLHRGAKLRGIRGPERLDMIAGLLPVPE